MNTKAKLLIYSVPNSNMAGSEWDVEFYLERHVSGRYSVRVREITSGGRARRIGVRRQLITAVDVFEAIEELASDAAMEFRKDDFEEIAARIADLDVRFAQDFLAAPEAIEERDELALASAETEREAALRPFRETIDNYVLRFSDSPLRFPGGGSYGTQRAWVRRFIEDYVLANGRLPSGRMQIVVQANGAGYRGGEHDFSDIA